MLHTFMGIFKNIYIYIKIYINVRGSHVWTDKMGSDYDAGI